MAATAAQVLRLRRMIADVDDAAGYTYEDDTLEDFIESYPLLDSDGNEPDDDAWTATYDLNAAARDIWEEKAAAVADRYDVNADGATLSRSQLFDQAMRAARRYGARVAASSVTLRRKPDPNPLDAGLPYFTGTSHLLDDDAVVNTVEEDT